MPSGRRPSGGLGRVTGLARRRVYNAAVVRPESCIKLTGASPVAVSAAAPRSRPRAWVEMPPPERGVKGPQRVVWLVRGEQVRRPSIKRTVQPRDIRTRKVGPAEPLMPRRRQQTASGRGGEVLPCGGMQDARGVGRRACGHSSVRNRRDPSRRPTSDEGAAHKPKVKGRRAGRESEGPVVLTTPPTNGGRGKGPCFGRGGVWR